MKNCFTLFIFTVIVCGSALAQIKVEVECQPHLEYRHGFGSLFPDNIDTSVFISPGTHLNTNFKMITVKPTIFQTKKE